MSRSGNIQGLRQAVKGVIVMPPNVGGDIEMSVNGINENQVMLTQTQQKEALSQDSKIVEVVCMTADTDP